MCNHVSYAHKVNWNDLLTQKSLAHFPPVRYLTPCKALSVKYVTKPWTKIIVLREDPWFLWPPSMVEGVWRMSLNTATFQKAYLIHELYWHMYAALLIISKGVCRLHDRDSSGLYWYFHTLDNHLYWLPHWNQSFLMNEIDYKMQIVSYLSGTKMRHPKNWPLLYMQKDIGNNDVFWRHFARLGERAIVILKKNIFVNT